MRNIVLMLVATLCLGLLSPAFALDLGSNITIYDKNSDSETGWSGKQEDNEVEPGMVGSQVWDLEGFFFDQSNTLSLVGGYDFLNGEVGNGLLFESGDIFLAKTEPDYGIDNRATDGIHKVDKTYGYDFVLDLDFTGTTYTYTVIEFGEEDDDIKLETAYYRQNEGSSPWRYVSGGTSKGTGTFTFKDGLSDDETGFSGNDSHYLLTGFDLSFLGHGTDFYSHFTMGCGNDNLMGQGTVVPEPSTFLLFAAGGGLALLARRRKDRK